MVHNLEDTGNPIKATRETTLHQVYPIEAGKEMKGSSRVRENLKKKTDHKIHP